MEKTGGPASGVRRSENLAEAEWRAALGAISDPGKRKRAEELLRAYAKLRERHARVDERHLAAQAAMARLPLGLVLVERTDVIWANEAAQQLLVDGAPLRIEDGKLIANGFELSALDAVRHVDQGREAIRVDEWQVMALGLELEHAPVLLAIAFGDGPVLAPDPETYQALFGLTAREARVATLLLEGRSGREIAEVLEVGFETARSHVKHVLRKMSCPRQAAAVLALSASPATVGPVALPVAAAGE